MKNKKIFILIAVVITIAIILTTILLVKRENNTTIKKENTTAEQRNTWNDFLNANPYLSQILEFNETEYISDNDLIKFAITSENVETEYIVTEEINKNSLLSLGDGYKKSKSNIKKYLKEILNIDEIAYNFVETYVEEDNYLFVEQEYVYFTNIELQEKIYLAIEYGEKNEKYEVKIYEYDVIDENRELLNEMLETGEINNSVKTSNQYILTGQIKNGNISINAKTSL